LKGGVNMSSFFWEVKKLFLNRKIQLYYLAIFLFVALLCFGFSWEPALLRIFQESNFYGINPHEFINGNLFLRLSSILCMNSLIPIFVCIMAVGQFAGEEESGVLKTLIASSENRSRIFWNKIGTLMIHVMSLILFMFFVSYLIGFSVFGHGDLIAGNNYLENILKGLRTLPESLSFSRQGLAVLFSWLSLVPLWCLAIFMSVLTSRALPALSITLAIFFGAQTLRSLPISFFSRLTSKFFVAYMNFWGDVFLEVIPWKDILYMGTFVAAYGLSFLILSCGVFQLKNIKT
jgi:ABC-type transport system involved in multi-copper enzyme maturation permease subunit